MLDKVLSIRILIRVRVESDSYLLLLGLELGELEGAVEFLSLDCSPLQGLDYELRAVLLVLVSAGEFVLHLGEGRVEGFWVDGSGGDEL